MAEPQAPGRVSSPNPLGLKPFDPAEPYVFVSYSRTDIAFVRRFSADLQANGVNVWIDQIGLTPGTANWDRALRDAVRGSTAFLLIASPASRESNYVADEITLGRLANRPIYPIWAAGEQFMDAISMGMGRTQYIDARSNETYAEAVKTTIRAIRGSAPELQAPEFITPKRATLKPHQIANPYKGLAPFRAQDRELFFGSTALIASMVAALKEKPNFLAILGASGSGKSSVVMAGLLPTLADGAIPTSRGWAYLMPFTPSGSPIERLAEVFANELPQKTVSLVRNELDDPSAQGIARLARQVIKLDTERRVVLYIDQFEELFTLTRSNDEREQFINLITATAANPEAQVSIVITMRADFYDRALDYPALAPLMVNQQIAVTRMSLAELYEAVRAPATSVGVDFEDGELVSQIVFAVRNEPGMLPLLQFTLAKLYELRTAGKMTRAAYQDIGEVTGALAQHAEAIFTALPSEEHRQRARDLFMRLITPGASDQDAARRRARISELNLVDAAARSVINEVKEAFVKARLIITDRTSEEETIEVSHEALLRRWERLTAWLHDAREDILLAAELSATAEDWARRGRPADQPERLYQFSKLREAQDWMTRNLPDQLTASFLDASQAFEHEQERQAEARRIELQHAAERAEQATARADQAALGLISARRVAFGIFVLAAIAVTVALLFIITANTANDDARAAEQTAVAAKAIALAAEATAEAVQATAVAQQGTAVKSVQDAESEVSAAEMALGTAAAAAAQAATDAAEAEVQAARALLAGTRAADSLTQAAQELSEAEEQSASIQQTAAAQGTQAANLGFELDDVSEIAAEAVVTDAREAISTSKFDSAALLSIFGLSRIYNADLDAVLTTALDSIPEPALRLPTGSANIASLVFNSTGTTMLSSGQPPAIWAVGGAPLRAQQQTIDDGASIQAHFRPDDAAVLVIYDDGRAVQRASDTYALLCPAIQRLAPISAAAYSRDGAYFALADQDGPITLWSASTCALLREFTVIDSSVTALAFADAGLLSGHGTGTITLWNIDTTAIEATFRLHNNLITGLAVLPDGQTFISASRDGEAIAWRTGSEAWLWRHATGTPSEAMALSPDAAHLALASANNIEVISVSDGTTLHSLYQSSVVTAIAFAPGGRYLATAHGAQQAIAFWDWQQTTDSRTFQAFTLIGRSASFTTVPDYIVLAGDNQVVLWDRLTNAPARVLANTASPFNEAAISSDARTVVTVGDDDRVRIWHMDENLPPDQAPAPIEIAAHFEDVFAVAINPASTVIATGGIDGVIRLWDAASGAPVRELLGHSGNVTELAFSPDGSYLASAGETSGTLVWNWATGDILRSFNEGSFHYSLVFSPDNALLLGAGNNGYLSIYDLIAGEIIGQADMPSGVEQLALSPSGGAVAIALSSEPPIVARLDDLLSWLNDTTDESLPAITRRYPGHFSYARSVSFSANGREVISIAEDGEARIWDTERADLLAYACWRIGRDLGQSERSNYLSDSAPVCNIAAERPALTNLTVTAPDQLVLPITAPMPTFSATMAPFAPTPTSDIEVRQAEIGRQEGDIPPNGGQRWDFAGTAGMRVRISVEADQPANDATNSERQSQNLLDVLVNVYDPSGQRIASADDIERARLTNALISDLLLKETGAYWIDVRAYSNTGSGGYSLDIQELLPATITPTASPLAFTPPPTLPRTLIATPTASLTPSATPTLTPIPTEGPTATPAERGMAVLGANQGELLSGASETWVYRGREGETITVSVESDFDTTLAVLRGDEVIAENDDDSSLDYGLNSRVEVTLPVSAPVTLVVGSYNDQYNCPYTLRIGSSLATPNPAWTATPSRTPTLTPTLAPTIAPLGVITFGEHDGILTADGPQRWQFDGRGGETVTFTVRAAWDTTLSVRFDGVELDYNDDTSSLRNGLNSQISLELPATGRYDVIVASFASGGSGPYVLSITPGLPTPDVDEAVMATATPQAQEIDLGEITLGIRRAVLMTDTRHSFDYEGQANEFIRVRASARWDIVVRLYDSDGDLLAKDDEEQHFNTCANYAAWRSM